MVWGRDKWLRVLLPLPPGMVPCTDLGSPGTGDTVVTSHLAEGGRGLTGDVAGQGQALAVLVLEGGGDRVQPQEEKGLWAQGGGRG